MVQRTEIMDYREILKIVSQAIIKEETVDIYYPKTEGSTEGWREVEPLGFSADTDSQYLIYGKDEIGPGHLLNAKFQKEGVRSFVVGKIKKVRLTGRKRL